MAEYREQNPTLHTLAAAVLDHGDLFPDLLTAECAVADALPIEQRDEFFLAVELCPIHRCDINICADDGVAECEEFWK